MFKERYYFLFLAFLAGFLFATFFLVVFLATFLLATFFFFATVTHPLSLLKYFYFNFYLIIVLPNNPPKLHSRKLFIKSVATSMPTMISMKPISL
ncbi:MAG: hypothetical protein QG603_332 [Patescibacteria group bacterium]|nr:hypothetical protein [Patescibacteria group bacterium]